ncbi:MAG: hypothetical protein K2X69_05520 [Silvanigrellaceae bacterium]|nr:hypothetical protein [Silvanigrellaceae bacterium]
MSIKIESNKKIEAIASQLLYHKKLYYTGRSLISDMEYDSLEDQLKKLSPNHPVLSLVGYQFEDSGKKISHQLPMLSLAKTYSIEYLFDFLNKNPSVAMDKLDGMALSIEYDENGKFLRASTRGNGKLGEDVTEHVYYITNIPKKLNIDKKWQGFHFEIRGEIYFPHSEFQNFQDRFDSFRNAVPGTLGRKDVEEAVDVLRVLHFCVYDLLVFDNKSNYVSAKEIPKYFDIPNNYLSKLNLTKKMGFEENMNYVLDVTDIKNRDELNLVDITYVLPETLLTGSSGSSFEAFLLFKTAAALLSFTFTCLIVSFLTVSIGNIGVDFSIFDTISTLFSSFWSNLDLLTINTWSKEICDFSVNLFHFLKSVTEIL